ncbi:MAG: non-homologous end-joining DNA ligase [Actinomycetota bacterium]|nr:non-homologous end-joining DNA ligase [Actinomycetota bacterium]
MAEVPTTVAFPRPLQAVRDGDAWLVAVGGGEVRATNLDKVFWGPEGYTKADLLAYYLNMAERILPYLRDRPLTLKRMPDGADGDFFYAKQAPVHTPEWVATAPVVSRDGRGGWRAEPGKRIDYLLAQDTRSLLWLVNLGCIELHPWHSRIDDLGRPDYAFFDLDPFDVDFATVREVALVVRTALERLGLRGYPRTSGATGMQVYVPIDRVHSYGSVREWVGRVCRLINRADPERTTMEWEISARAGKVFLDHNMNTEGRNIAATWSLRPERGAPVATPLAWDEVEGDVEPRDFTIATIWGRLGEDDSYRRILEGGQDLRAAMETLGMGLQADEQPAAHELAPRGELGTYASKRDFSKTPEPPPSPRPAAARGRGRDPRFVVQHHLATRLHHDLRLERGDAAPSWAIPKGLPEVPGLRHLAVRTEDHPLEYLDFSGDIPAGEYGAGPMRIWDTGSYELLEWRDDHVKVRLQGSRHRGEWHLFRTGTEDGKQQWLVVRADEPAPEELPGPPPRLQPMLATLGGDPFDDPAWLFEVKWDGVRALATTTRPGTGAAAGTTLLSRHGNDISPAYPELADLWERVLARNAVLDGEVVLLGPDGVPSFQLLQQRMHLRDPSAVERAARRSPVSYVAFDLLAADGESLVDLALTERLARLEEVLVPGGAVQRSEPVAGQGLALFDAVVQRGLEGVIAKRAQSPYRPGRRSRDWRKIKLRRRIDCVIGGWLPGEGARAGRLGSLLVGLYDQGGLRYVGRVGSGFDAEELARLGRLLDERAHQRSPFDGPTERGGRWVEPTLVCRVEYAEVTGDARLRAPSYKGLVADAEPERCLLEDLAQAGGKRSLGGEPADLRPKA